MKKAPAKKVPAKKAAPAKKTPVKPVKAKKTAPKAKPAPVPHRTDWEAIERDFRAGKLTLREMAEKHSITAGRICQVSKEKGWSRGDLQESVRKATTAILIAEHIEGEVNKVKQGLNETVLAAAELNKQVILRHRDDLSKAREVSMRMLDELSITTTSADEIEALFEKVTEEMSGPSLLLAQQRFREFMKLHSRVGSVHKLSDTLKKLQELERKAFGLDEEGKGGVTGYEDALADVISEIEGK